MSSAIIFVLLLTAFIMPVHADTDQVDVPILLYHKLSRSPRAGTYTITPASFEQDLLCIQERGYVSVTFAQLVDYVNGRGVLPEKCVVITFDDGDQSVDRYAVPLLRKYKMKAEVAVIGRVSDKYSSENRRDITYPNLTWAQMRNLSGDGTVVIESHGYDIHGAKGAMRRKGEDCDEYARRLTEDLSKLQDTCYQHLGKVPIAFAYPYGFSSRESEQVLDKMGFKVSMTSRRGINQVRRGHPEDLRLMRRNDRPLGMSSKRFLTRSGVLAS